MYLRAVLPRQEGRTRRHERGAGCGGRGSVARRAALVADGKAVWSWRPDAGAKLAEQFASDGGKRARSPGRARNTPLKPLCREGRMIRHHLWRLPCAYYQCTRAAGASWAPGLPCALCLRGTSLCKARAWRPRECGRMHSAASTRLSDIEIGGCAARKRGRYIPLFRGVLDLLGGKLGILAPATHPARHRV
jgi:hypothetical protein